MKTDQQAALERVRTMLKRKPARADRLRVEWNRVAVLLADYLEHARPPLKSFEAHHRIELARAVMMVAIDAGVPDNTVWIYAMHGAGFPAAPHPKTKATT